MDNQDLIHKTKRRGFLFPRSKAKNCETQAQEQQNGFLQKTQLILEDEPEILPEAEKNDDFSLKTEILFDDALVQIGASTVIGKRSSQQDSIIFPDQSSMYVGDTTRFICALSDGMGGLAAGEVASKLATETIFSDYYAQCWKKPAKSYSAFFQAEAEQINEKILDIKNENGDPLRAGATLIATVLDGKNLYYLNIGDSRIYLFRNGEVLQITKDQNYLSLLMQEVARGEITLNEANTHPKKDALISYCGIRELKLQETNEEPIVLQKQDVLMLCSDGLYRVLPQNEMLSIINDNLVDMNLAAYRLTNAALQKNYRGQDNTSVILIKIN
jgi:protein phosphatase